MRKLVSMIAALAMVATFAMSAAAADWNFYGSARIETFVDSVDVTGGDDTDDFSLDQATNSRIGANVAVSDELTGRFEYGAGDNASIRLLYGKWNFGGGALTVGQDYTPIANGSGYSQQFKNANTGLIGYGMPYGGRVPQIKLSFGDFHIAAMHNTDLEEDVQDEFEALATTTAYTTLGVTAATATNAQRVQAEAAGAAYAANIGAENKFPRVEARYFYDVGPVRLRAAGGYATVELNDNNTPGTGWSEDFDAYFLGFGAKFAQGPFYAEANYGMGENLSVLGISTTTTALPGVDYNTGEVTDAETDMYYILAGFQFNDMFAAEIGWGTEETEIGTADQEAVSYYLTLPITLAPGVMVRPEVGVFDEEDAGGTETTYYGVTWQINF